MINAQNNAIFKGGNADGWENKNFFQNNSTVFLGGNADGWAVLNYSQQTSAIFHGGNADGWAMLNYSQQTSTIFHGGNGDGWVSLNYKQANSNIFKGGNADGWDNMSFVQLNKNIFTGGIGDGWASTYRPQGTLPVTLIYFTADKLTESASLLKWQTAQEINSAYFEIQQSNDAISFLPIGKIAAAGNTATAINYSFIDYKPLPGINYYRLKQIDKDGKFIYTPSRVVKFDATAGVVKYFPNPTNGLVNIKITEQMRLEAKVINISNVAGIVVNQIKIPANANNMLTIDLSYFAKGIYFIQVKTSTINSTERIVLQ
jgi:hypothetical protein